MGQDPDAIRDEIEETRLRMGDTVEALTYKADVRGRVGDVITEKRDSIMDKKDQVVSKVMGAAPDPNEVKANAQNMASSAQQNAQQAVSVAQENPLGLAVGAIALGFLAGMVIPSTNFENEKVGEVSDQLKSRVSQTGQQALQSGKSVAQDVAQGAVQSAQESVKTHGQEIIKEQASSGASNS